MNIFVIHGDDTEKSYQRLVKFCEVAIKRNWEIVYLDDSPLSLTENLSSNSLFTTERFFVHRQFSKITKQDLLWISKNNQKYEGNLVVYADVLLSKTPLTNLPKTTKIEEYKLPVLIWRFLDSLYPGNTKEALELLYKIVEKNPPEFLFGLIARHLKDLYKTKIDPYSVDIPPWRITKLKNQSNNFRVGALEHFVSGLSKIDIKSKTTNSSLISLLDVKLVENLEFNN